METQEKRFDLKKFRHGTTSSNDYWHSNVAENCAPVLLSEIQCPRVFSLEALKKMTQRAESLGAEYVHFDYGHERGQIVFFKEVPEEQKIDIAISFIDEQREKVLSGGKLQYPPRIWEHFEKVAARVTTTDL